MHLILKRLVTHAMQEKLMNKNIRKINVIARRRKKWPRAQAFVVIYVCYLLLVKVVFFFFIFRYCVWARFPMSICVSLCSTDDVQLMRELLSEIRVGRARRRYQRPPPVSIFHQHAHQQQQHDAPGTHTQSRESTGYECHAVTANCHIVHGKQL